MKQKNKKETYKPVKKYDLKKLSIIGVTIFIWIYYFVKGMRIDWWKMAFFNGLMIYGIIKGFEDNKNDTRKKI